MALSTIANSQDLTTQGNTWILWQVNWDLATGGEFHLKIDGDTLINNLSYATVLRNDDVLNPSWYRLNYYLREDLEKRVYILDSMGQEGILYHFGLETGQQTELWNGYTATVESIDSVLVSNNEMRKRFKIKATGINSMGQSCWAGTYWIEGIGNIGPHVFSFCQEDDISYGLECFLKDNALYWPAQSNSCERFATATKYVDHSNLEVFPNPVTEMLTIRFDKESIQSKSIQLFGPQGQLVYHNVTHDQVHQVDMSQMTNGIFFLQVFYGDNILVCRKLVKL